MAGGGLPYTDHLGSTTTTITPERLKKLVKMSRQQPGASNGRGGNGRGGSSHDKEMSHMAAVRGGMPMMPHPSSILNSWLAPLIPASLTAIGGLGNPAAVAGGGKQHAAMVAVWSDMAYLPALREMAQRGVDIDDYNATAAMLSEVHSEHETAFISVMSKQPVLMLVGLFCAVLGTVLGIATLAYLEMASRNTTVWEHSRSKKYFEQRRAEREERRGKGHEDEEDDGQVNDEEGSRQAGRGPMMMPPLLGAGFRRRAVPLEGGTVDTEYAAARSAAAGDSSRQPQHRAGPASSAARCWRLCCRRGRRCCDRLMLCCCCCCWGSESAFDRGDCLANCDEVWRAAAMAAPLSPPPPPSVTPVLVVPVILSSAATTAATSTRGGGGDGDAYGQV